MNNLKQFFLLLTFLLAGFAASAQTVPSGINYQAVLRNVKGEIISDQPVGIKVSVLDPETRTYYYAETHQVMTNQAGIFTLVVGGGKAEQGRFSDIPWATANTWLEVAYDTDGNGIYDLTGTTRMLSVPYAFYAERAGIADNQHAVNPNDEKGDGFEEEAWMLKGNDGIDDMWMFLGSRNYADLVFKTHDVERMRITKGIGAEPHDALIHMYEDVEAHKSMLINETLTVGGKTLLNDELMVVGKTHLMSDLAVDGETYMAKFVKIGGNLNLEGQAVMNKDLDVLGTGVFGLDVKINRNLLVGNDVDIKHNLNVDNDAHIGNNLDVDNNANIDVDLHVGRDADIDRNLNVDNNANIDVDLHVGNNLDVDGNGNIDMNLHVGKDADVDQNLNVDNNANIDVDLHVGNNLDVDNNVNIDNNLTVQNNATIVGDLNVDGSGSFYDMSIQNNLNVGNNIDVDQNLNVDKSVTIGVDLTVTDDVTIGDDLTVSGISLFESAVTMENNLTVKQNLTVNNNLNVSNDVTIGGDLNVNNPINANCRLVVNSCVSGSDSDIDSYPVVVQGGNQGVAIKVNGTRGNDNNFVAFWDNSGIQGRIEGQTYNELLSSFPFIWSNSMKAAEEALSIAMVIACGLQADVAEAIVWGVEGLLTLAEWIEYNVSITDNVGVAYESGSGDYAEWLERANVQEDYTFGEVVGVRGGKISRNTAEADHYMVISKAPIVLGNMPDPAREKNFEKVAFMGQVPVRVMGKVGVGDYILPSGFNDGYARAVSPAKMQLEDYGKIVGVAWESGEAMTLNMVNVAVGLNQNDMSGQLAKQLQEINTMKQQLNQLFQMLGQKAPYDELNAQNAAVSPDRLAATSGLVHSGQLANLELSNMVQAHPDIFIEAFAKAKAKLLENGIDVNKYPEIAQIYDQPIEWIKKQNEKGYLNEMVVKAKAQVKASAGK
ncbi:MAG TPA: hypothetical protein DCF33_05880 [Saprospirales bacterium]|nr:hypothetical protein [Saprospirales bacterium]